MNALNFVIWYVMVVIRAGIEFVFASWLLIEISTC